MVKQQTTSKDVELEHLPPGRIRFHVKLSTESTPLVSWPQLQTLVPFEIAAGIPSEKPAMAKEDQFNGIFEKIERLYEGDDSAEQGGGEGSEYDSDDSFIDDGELDMYFQVDRTKTRHQGYFINKGALESLKDSSAEMAPLKVFTKRKKNRGNEETGVQPKRVKFLEPVDDLRKTVPEEAGPRMVFRPAPRGLLKVKVEQAAAAKEPLTERQNGLPGLNNVEEPKEASPGKRKVTCLQKAVQDLESGVAEFCPPSPDGKEDTKGKRLHKEVKTRLAKVVRLAKKQDKLTDEFVQGLMKMFGHLMQPKTLKKHIKEMVELALTAQREKQGKLDTVKLEIQDMVRERLPVEADGTKKVEYAWDSATEDRLYSLYELYTEGLDEPKGSSCKKLYAELVALWPEGYMDSNGIKFAVSRARERRKGASKLAKVEDKKRKLATKPAIPLTKKLEKSSTAAAAENVKPTVERAVEPDKEVNV